MDMDVNTNLFLKLLAVSIAMLNLLPQCELPQTDQE